MVVSVPVLVVAAVFLYRHSFRKAPQETEASVTGVAPLTAVDELANEIDWLIPDPLPVVVTDPIEDPEQVPIPEQEQIEQPDRQETTNVKAILFSANKPSAIVGGQIVYVGDSIGDATVTNILRDGVEFTRNGETWLQKIRK
jgi:hypothetical protein